MENYFNRILENNSIPKQIRETVCSEMHHALEVSNMAVLISKDEKFCDDIAVAGVLHDIGKLRVNRYVYSDESDDTLVVEQMKYVRMHSAYSRDILRDENYPENIIEAVYHHHENYDGSGYPDGLKGTDIPEINKDNDNDIVNMGMAKINSRPPERGTNHGSFKQLIKYYVTCSSPDILRTQKAIY